MDCIDQFLCKRPGKEDDCSTMSVEVQFQPGKNSISPSLFIGGEGAGSRDATFNVRITDKVETLALQAAKYWGLAADKVFFLDRDGRIVPEKMLLSDIILPPLIPGHGHSKNVIEDTNMSSGFGNEASKRKGDAWMVRGRSYRLTLVRATTVLQKEHLGSKDGEKPPIDPTFDANELEAELEKTRKARGDIENSVTKAQELDQIPSLFDLIQKGIKKSERKRADSYCRAVEFFLLMVSFLLFYGLVAIPLDSRFETHGFLELIDLRLSNFTIAEQRRAGVLSFDQISKEEQWNQWLDGPLRRSSVRPGMERDNNYVLLVMGVSFSIDNPTSHNVDWCANTQPLTARVSGNASDACNDNASNASNASSICTPKSVAPNNCYSKQLQKCSQLDAVEIFHAALKDGHQVPECNHIPTALLPGLEFTQKPFTSFAGVTTVQYNGDSSFLNTTDEKAWNESIQAFRMSTSTSNAGAKMIVVFVFNPSINSVAAVRLLVENTMSGTLLTEKRTDNIALSDRGSAAWLGYILAIILSTASFIMQLRTIVGYPKSCATEKLEQFGYVPLLVPITMLVNLVIELLRRIKDINTIVTFSGNEMSGSEANDFLSVIALYQRFDGVLFFSRMLTLMLLSITMLRYLIDYFPMQDQLHVVAEKMWVPLAISFFLVCFMFLCLGVLLYSFHSTNEIDFKNILLTFLSVVRFASGGLNDVESYVRYYPTVVWLIFATVSTVAIKMISVALPIAIIVSYKKEKDLFESYSYHPCWAAKRKSLKDVGNFNPAKAGKDTSEMEH
eukprot:TRINITY_DN8830_c1_g1_i1.p1 TRINITY_DN8830_c1_g1~~TRINITY_DN8830_c1_g1_i1.p1  ORF type:complete len:786 (-),score=93.86 TRINITY_DN8830_c1_g1_i1:431-2788(-)